MADERFVAAMAPLPTRVSPPTVVAARRSEELSANPVNWRRQVPREADVIVVQNADQNPAGGSALERARAAVVSLRGFNGHGTAFILTRDGLALTNYHVVAGERRLQARTATGTMLPVRVLRTDSTSDLALIEIACGTDCNTIPIDARPMPVVGDDVFAIGTPVSEALNHSVTRGIVSGVRRRGAISLVQTDAAVNPGNSGGPLVHAGSGAALAIVTLKIVSEDVEGVAFGVNLTDALRVLGVVVQSR